MAMVTYMDRQLFRAAEDGDMEPFIAYQNQLDRLVDADQNTALHIYCSTGGYKVVKVDDKFKSELHINDLYLGQLLKKCPSLLRQGNAKGEIPLHVAARHGHPEMVEFLIQRSKEQDGEDLEQMLRMRDKEQNTALHLAAQYGHLDVVKALLKEDPDLSASVNASGETPLYLAARGNDLPDLSTYLTARGNDPQRDELVSLLLLEDTNCSPRALLGPRGRTILHAAVLAGDERRIRRILKEKRHLTKEGDEDGRTPLHYAVHFGCPDSVVEALLEYDATAAYITDQERGMSPLHMAAWGGHIRIMKCIIFHCPGCLGIVDKRGWNFLHFAFLTKPSILETLHLHLFYDETWRFRPGYVISILRNLLETKGVNGITPFHVYRYGPAAQGDYNITTGSDINLFELGCWVQVLLWDELSEDSELIKKNIEQVLTDIRSVRVVGLPANSFRDVEEAEDKEAFGKVRETHLLVVALVATVSFTAGLTVPGGYHDKGNAILSHNTAFKAFVITDTFAFVSSLSAVLIHFYMVYHDNEVQRFLHKIVHGLTYFAMVMMVIAFSTGLYAVLEPSSGIAIAACFIADTFFLGNAFIFFFRKLLP